MIRKYGHFRSPVLLFEHRYHTKSGIQNGVEVFYNESSEVVAKYGYLLRQGERGRRPLQWSTALEKVHGHGKDYLGRVKSYEIKGLKLLEGMPELLRKEYTVIKHIRAGGRVDPRVIDTL